MLLGKRAIKRAIVVLLGFLYAGCGTTASNALQVLYAGVDAFSDATVDDVVYCARNVPVGTSGLDQNDDRIPDFFVFPSTCPAITSCMDAKTTGCGYSVASSGEITLGDLPSGFRYELRAEFRDAAGAVLYCGAQEFANDDSSPSVTVNIAAGACP